MSVNSGRSRSQIDVKAGLILAAMFIAVWVLWDTPIVYPIKIFVVSLHELGTRPGGAADRRPGSQHSGFPR